MTLHKPSVKLLLNYEYQMRKEVIDKVNEGSHMADAFKEVTKNSNIRERHFSTPSPPSGEGPDIASWLEGEGPQPQVAAL